ncbi:MAG: hypothetical protein JKY50_22410 [Oleispira sp.]|nr:hypothetical protein [Oleispira sp.]
MSKLSKLFGNPKQFFVDAYFNKYPERKYKKTLAKIVLSHQIKRPTAILIGFSDWKTWMIDVLPDYNVVFLGHSPEVSASLLKTIPKFFEPTVFCWSYKFPHELRDLCLTNDICITFVEDGFIRGSGLGIAKTNPMSLVFDSQAMHFDHKKTSALDDLLNTHEINSQDMKNVAKFRQVFEAGVTKYIRADSGSNLSDELNLYGENVIVILGQVEDDLSIQYGANRFYSGNDLVKIAALENPGSRILYRPHPESIQRRKKHYSNPKDVSNLCDIIGRRWSLKETLEVADRVYTVTSFAGFEAALMGKIVELFGLPFYGGWGFTNDRHDIDTTIKRTRKLTTDVVLAITLGRYATYFHPVTMERITPIKAAEYAESIAYNLAAAVERKHKKALAEIEFVDEKPTNSETELKIIIDAGRIFSRTIDDKIQGKNQNLNSVHYELIESKTCNEKS